MNCSTCGTNYPNDLLLTPGCSNCSKKCHDVVDTLEEAVLYHNAFVTVREENAVYHVDEVGNPLLISRSPIYASSDYTPAVNDYQKVTVYQFSANKFYVFDPSGQFKTGVLA